MAPDLPNCDVAIIIIIDFIDDTFRRQGRINVPLLMKNFFVEVPQMILIIMITSEAEALTVWKCHVLIIKAVYNFWNAI